MLSMITPPVAIGAYAAANIARVSGWTTGWTAVVVGWSTFFIPFLFVLEPSLLMIGPWWLIAWNCARNLLGIFVGTAALVGFAFGPLSTIYTAILLEEQLWRYSFPANAFAGADLLDWIGLCGSIVVLAVNFWRNRVHPQLEAAGHGAMVSSTGEGQTISSGGPQGGVG